MTDEPLRIGEDGLARDAEGAIPCWVTDGWRMFMPPAPLAGVVGLQIETAAALGDLIESLREARREPARAAPGPRPRGARPAEPEAAPPPPDRTRGPAAPPEAGRAPGPTKRPRAHLFLLSRAQAERLAADLLEYAAQAEKEAGRPTEN